VTVTVMAVRWLGETVQVIRTVPVPVQGRSGT